MILTYDLRRDADGWSVFDRWTNQTVVVFEAFQQGLEKVQAQELADQLNDRFQQGDRTVLQFPSTLPPGDELS